MTRESKHDLRSMTKSVVSALAGIAISAGAIQSLDQPVVEWFPEYPDLDTPDRRRMTLAHVLAMTSGLEWNEDVPYNDQIPMTRDARARDTVKFGSLYLNGGQWNGERVIPADWIQHSTRRHFRFPPRTGADASGRAERSRPKSWTSASSKGSSVSASGR